MMENKNALYTSVLWYLLYLLVEMKIDKWFEVSGLDICEVFWKREWNYSAQLVSQSRSMHDIFLMAIDVSAWKKPERANREKRPPEGLIRAERENEELEVFRPLYPQYIASVEASVSPYNTLCYWCKQEQFLNPHLVEFACTMKNIDY